MGPEELEVHWSYTERSFCISKSPAASAWGTAIPQMIVNRFNGLFVATKIAGNSVSYVNR